LLKVVSNRLEEMLQAGGVPLLATGARRIYSPGQVRPLARIMARYDLVHVHLFPAQLWAVLAVGRAGKPLPLLVTEHGSSNYRRRWWLRRLDRWMYARYQAVACNSEATVRELVAWVPGVAPKVRLIPNGIPLQEFETAPPADLPRLANAARKLLFVGRMEPPKDHATLLRALAEVPDAQLLLVGDGPARRALEELARKLGVAARVRFLGRRDDVPQLLKASDVYVHSSGFEGFGMAVCEAMAAGLPVVVSNVSGLAQLVSGAGVLFPGGDHEALARELRALLASPERRAALGAAARERAQLFSIDRTVDGYVKLYDEMLGQ
jgi:glycosyltransferase involved in cell wall biosynthesis